MDAQLPQRLRHAKSSGSVLHDATTNFQNEVQRLRPTKSSYLRRVVERSGEESQQPRRITSSYFKRAVGGHEDGVQQPRRTRSSFFRHGAKQSQDETQEPRRTDGSHFQHTAKESQDGAKQPRRTKSLFLRHAVKQSQDSGETKPHLTILSKIKAAFTKSHTRNPSNAPSQLASKLQMSRLEYRMYALNHYSTPQQYHRIHLSSILFHPITAHLLLVKDPIGQKFSIPETAMFSRHSSLGEALREGLLARTGLRISEVKREILPVWEFEGAWKFGDGNGEMKSVMLNFVVEVENLEAAGRDTIWVGEECVDGLGMERGMKNLVKWVFDERVGAEW